MAGRMSRRSALAGAGTSIVLAGGGAAAEERVWSGTVDIEQVQVAFIGSGAAGGGALHFRGRSYRFSIGGLGIGGFGISKLEAHGVVYNLRELGQFPGAYGSARTGVAAGDQGHGQMWLENPHGVIMSLKARRQGLALSMGADAVVISFA
ncbi:hypothetical protein [Reyranella sp.]|uniref:hypothetical protein n=1 Tax=Reyranella sp. TaxID=1929291 RepID=UPI003BAA8EFB